MSDEPQIKLANSAKWHGGERWGWDVWVEAPPDRLQQIEKVEYILHPTFPQRVRQVSDRESNFKLSGRGWGEFMIHANALLKNGETLQLNHWLTLEDSGEQGLARSTGTYKPAVFLSYSRADYPVAAQLEKFFAQRGLHVISDQEIDAGASMESAIRGMLSKVDAVVVLLADEPGRWVLLELKVAIMQQLPIVPILLGKEAVLPQIISDRDALRIENPEDQSELLRAVEQELEKLNI
jgi:hypothetical protein